MINYWLEYTDFVRIGQAILSGKNLVGTPQHSAMEEGVDTAYNAYEEVESLEDDEKLAVWMELSGYSKVRSWLKKIGEERRKATA